MRRYWYRRALLILLVATTLIGGGFGIQKLREEYAKTEVITNNLGENDLIPGGMPVGIYMETDGVLVLGTEPIKGKDGIMYEPAKRVVKSGDYIVEMNGTKIRAKRVLIDMVKQLNGEAVTLKIRRGEEYIDVQLQPIALEDDTYKLGIWVRDNVQGLGTITFLTKNNEFGALGHGIHDTDTSAILEIARGTLYETSIKGIQKGESGTPGGMEGVIVYSPYNKLGVITRNTENGIFGTLNDAEAIFAEIEPMPICSKKDASVGKASIRCAVEGELKEYEIEIVRIDFFSREVNKEIVLKVTDEKLLEVTGGIVQGMSGSPILQNGKIVGAVTHVLVNDPTRGYGIFIEEMLEAGE